MIILKHELHPYQTLFAKKTKPHRKKEITDTTEHSLLIHSFLNKSRFNLWIIRSDVVYCTLLESYRDRQLSRLYGSRPGQSHGHGILKVTHEDGREGEHKGRQELLGIIIDLSVGEGDAGTEESNPSRPLELHHEATHGEDHRQEVHVIGRGIIR